MKDLIMFKLIKQLQSAETCLYIKHPTSNILEIRLLNWCATQLIAISFCGNNFRQERQILCDDCSILCHNCSILFDDCSILGDDCRS